MATGQAKVVRWDLENVTFGSDVAPNAQGSGSGFFLFDADAAPGSKLIAWDISVRPYPPLPAYRFNSLTEPDRGHQYENSVYFYSKTLYDLDPVGRIAIELVLTPDAALSDAGGTLALSGTEGTTYITEPRKIVTGQLVAATIPEPSQILLLMLGLIVLGLRSSTQGTTPHR
jgi:hypothetical protein